MFFPDELCSVLGKYKRFVNVAAFLTPFMISVIFLSFVPLAPIEVRYCELSSFSRIAARPEVDPLNLISDSEIFLMKSTFVCTLPRYGPKSLSLLHLSLQFMW